VYLCSGEEKKKLLLRDNVILDEHGAAALPDFTGRLDGLGVFGTLIIRGPVFEGLGKFFVDEFGKMPRIGARKWGDEEEDHLGEMEVWRKARLKQEVKDGLLWTAVNVRGFVLVKFGAREVEGVKRWLRNMVRFEGSVELAFGERATHCLK
jgi:urease accessory protein